MITYNCIHEPDNWRESFDDGFLCLWNEHGDKVTKLLLWVERNRRLHPVSITTHDIFSETMWSMPRKKNHNGNVVSAGTNNNHKPNDRDQLIWVNIKLDDDDIVRLEQSNASFEYVAASLLGLADSGWRLSISTTSEGKSFCVTIIRSHPIRGGVSIGISSFGESVRDAGLACLYRWCDVLGETLDDVDNYISPEKQRRRFG